MAQGTKGGVPQVDLVDEIEDYSYKRFKIRRAIVRYRRADGRMSAPVERLSFDRGHAVGLLLYDKASDRVILIRQFRYPVYVSLSADERKGAERAWLLEIIAGTQEKDEAPEDVARREAMEEAGCTVSGPLELVAEVYPSPGGSSERITVYIAEVDRDTPVAGGGGVVDEGEDTEVVAMPFAQALSMVKTGEIADAKTVIALQRLALRLRSS